MIECPNHGGNFDCTPFCKVCEGNQEYKEDRYFSVKFSETPILFAYGTTALHAIEVAAADWTSEHRDTLGAAIARPAVYGEWDCAPHHFHNDGSHSHDYELRG